MKRTKVWVRYMRGGRLKQMAHVYATVLADLGVVSLVAEPHVDTAQPGEGLGSDRNAATDVNLTPPSDADLLGEGAGAQDGDGDRGHGGADAPPAAEAAPVAGASVSHATDEELPAVRQKRKYTRRKSVNKG